MRLSELLTELALVLDAKSSTNPNKWSLADRVISLNSQQRSLIRKTADLDEAYHNHTVLLAKTAARQVKQSIWSWRVPPWIVKVSVVCESKGGVTAARGGMIPRATKWVDYGWHHSSSNELRLVGFSQAIDLELEVAKLPARLTSGLLPAQPGPTQLQLEAVPTYPAEVQVDHYAGGLFEITSGAALGETLRAVASTPALLLTMEEAWAPAVPAIGNTWEMHAEIPTQHLRLLVLLAARSLFAQERNLEAIAAIKGELNEQWIIFIESIQNRDLSGPHEVVECIPTATRYPVTSYLEEYQ